MESDIVTMQDLFTFQIEDVTSARSVVGSLRPTGLRPHFLQKFEKHGMHLPTNVFQDGTGSELTMAARQ